MGLIKRHIKLAKEKVGMNNHYTCFFVGIIKKYTYCRKKLMGQNMKMKNKDNIDNYIQITIRDLAISIQAKNIKNMHLYVKPPNGAVVVTIPNGMNIKAVKEFILKNYHWIQKQQEQMKRVKQADSLAYNTGDMVQYQGSLYFLERLDINNQSMADRTKKQILLCDDKMIMRIQQDSTREQREALMEKWYREQMKIIVPPLLHKWETIMKVHTNEWRIKNMRTKWGTCNIRDKRIWLNLQLIKKAPECLEYVTVHELCHLLEPGHNSVFYAYMDQFLPDWKVRKAKLNSL